MRRRIVPRQHGRDVGAEGDFGLVGQCREIDQKIRLVGRRKRQSIGQHHPSFKVTVQNLYLRPIPGSHHITRADSARTGEVFGEREYGMHGDRATAPLQRTHHRQHRRAPATSSRMFCMAAGDFSDSPPLSNVMPLPTKLTTGLVAEPLEVNRTSCGPLLEPYRSPRAHRIPDG